VKLISIRGDAHPASCAAFRRPGKLIRARQDDKARALPGRSLSGFVSIIQTRCETRRSKRSVASIFGRFFSIPANNGKYTHSRVESIEKEIPCARIRASVASSFLSQISLRAEIEMIADNKNQNRHYCHRIISTLIILAKF